MAKLSLLAPWILSWEGGFVNDPVDRGGATHMGVTIATWRRVGYDKNGDGRIDVTDLRLLNREDVTERVLRPHYWDRWQADRITDQSVANLVVDWVWASGRHGITRVQQLLGVKVDGVVGEKTLTAVNALPGKLLFRQIWQARKAFIESIVKNNPSQERFRKGWLRRLEAIQYGGLVYNK